MNLTKIGIVTLLPSFCVCLSLADERTGIASEKSPETYRLPVRSAAKSPEVAATGGSEVFQDLVIPAGNNVFVDSTLDYSTANTVAVTIQCIVCSSAVTSLGASGLLLQARWSVPNASTYVTTENKTATAFPYWDAGGAMFNVYGSRFRLSLQNKGSQTIAIQQLTVFRRSQ
jgi:hypothetical protein